MAIEDPNDEADDDTFGGSSFDEADNSNDSDAVKATKDQVGTQEMRDAANDSFGSFLENRLESLLSSALEPSASQNDVSAYAGVIKKSVRVKIGNLLGRHGGILSGGFGGSAGSGKNLKLNSSKTLGAKVTFGKSFSVGFDSSMAGGKSGSKIRGVPTGPTSIGSKLGITPDLLGSFGPNAGTISWKSGEKPKVSQNIKDALDSALEGAGFSQSQIDALNENLAPAVDDSVSKSIDRAESGSLGYPHADGVPILRCRIVMPQRGKWTATYHVDKQDDDSNILSDLFVANINGVEYHGSIVKDRSGFWGGVFKIRVVGGAGSLDTIYDAKNYAKEVVLFSTIFNDILRDSGEVASDECDKTILNQGFQSWHRVRGTASHSLDMLCDHVGCEWRVLRDGTIWVGKDTWPEIEPSGTVMHEMHDEGIIKVHPEYASLVPGVIVRGQKIQKVVHVIDDRDPNASLRTDCHAQSERSLFDNIFDASNHKIKYFGRYPCTVTKQNADGTLQVMPEDDDIRGNGLDNCDVYVGLPGTKLKVPAGAQCLVAFRAGDPSRAYVDSWLQNTPFTSIDIG